MAVAVVCPQSGTKTVGADFMNRKMQTALSFNFIFAYERAPGKEEHPIAVDWDELEIP